MEIPNRLLIFTDPGLDDAMAIIYLLREIPLEVRIDIICVGGNNTACETFRNACSLIKFFDRNNIRIWRTDRIDQHFERLENIHGTDFLGLSDYVYANEYRYPDDWQDINEKCSILVLAACTIPDRINISPEQIEQIVVMGGGVLQSNYKGLEFNQAMDVASFNDFIIKNEHSIKMITIDSCRNEVFNLFNSNYAQLVPINTIEYKVYDQYCSLAVKRQSKYCIPYDLIAAFALLHPEMIIYEKQELIGLGKVRPLCMTGTTLTRSSDFWKCIWRI